MVQSGYFVPQRGTRWFNVGSKMLLYDILSHHFDVNLWPQYVYEYYIRHLLYFTTNFHQCQVSESFCWLFTTLLDALNIFFSCNVTSQWTIPQHIAHNHVILCCKHPRHCNNSCNISSWFYYNKWITLPLFLQHIFCTLYPYPCTFSVGSF